MNKPTRFGVKIAFRYALSNKVSEWEKLVVPYFKKDVHIKYLYLFHLTCPCCLEGKKTTIKTVKVALGKLHT